MRVSAKLVSFYLLSLACGAWAQEPTRSDLLKTIRHIETLAQETQQELDAERQAHAQTQSALATAQKANQDTQSQFTSYQAAAEAQIKKGNDAITSLAKLVKKHHLDLMILIGLWLGVCGFLYLQVGMKLGLPGIIGAAALAAIGISFILWRL